MKKEEPSKKIFSKEQLLKSKQFTATQKHALQAVLKDEKYTVQEAAAMLDKFLKKEVI